ncbi:hypothetical protein [Sulfitobacter sp. R18_1]|uniref:hypothetical protein n=1 Tax=Sulfitobacter sp. R18_1 TaxID=2821104 RepID=UPI001ADA2674|nr:hypothetical protein [Sulfitobacter sp. R18_1]MBO9427996.1 hypothetical protein [Sulfitobacter sp. R18_1]
MRLILPGDISGGPSSGIHNGDPVVEFYDADMKGSCVDGECYGRFVADYYMTTLESAFERSETMSLHDAAGVWTLDANATEDAFKTLADWKLDLIEFDPEPAEMGMSF